MTILEKFKADHPGVDTAFTVKGFCPEDFGYQRQDKTCSLEACDFENKACAACWGQELPDETEARHDGG